MSNKLTDAQRDRIAEISLNLFFSRNCNQIEEIVDRVISETTLHRFPIVAKHFEREVRKKVRLSLLLGMSQCN